MSGRRTILWIVLTIIALLIKIINSDNNTPEKPSLKKEVVQGFVKNGDTTAYYARTRIFK